jgi:hypothetical protein
VFDTNGIQVGVVHDAVIGSDLSVASIRFQTTASVMSRGVCVSVTAPIEVGQGAVRIATTQAAIISAAAR